MFYESYYGIAPLGQELSHHGIKGQKWGVRRFQNEDGSLTPEGRKHYGYDDDIVLKKGTGVTRYSNEEVLDNKRKYVSLTNTDDMREYDYYAREGFLDLDLSKDTYSYDYELTKDAKVASARQVSDYIVSKYGDKPIKELIKDADSAFSYYGKDFYNKVKNTKLKDIYNYDKMLADKKAGDDDDDDGAYSRAYVLGSGIGDQMKNTSISSDVFKEFSKRGYDAIIDVEDYWGGIAEMPIVMLNPKETMKFVRREDLWNSDMGSPYLMHYGVKGMKHGIRQWQYPDGSLTPAGYVHYGYGKTTSADRERMNGKQYTSKESNADNLKHFAELHPIETLSKIEKLSDEDFKSLSDTDLTMEFNPIRDNINNPVGEDNYTGRSYNCPNCAVAFEMTERGYAVSARPKPNGSNVEDIESFFKSGALVKFDAEGFSKEALDIMRESDKAWNEALKNGKDPWNDPKARELDEKAAKVQVETYKRINNKIEETLKAQGEGARGIMVAGWIGNYGWSNIDERTNAFHAFNYKVTKNGVQFHDVAGQLAHEHNGSYDGWKGEYDPRDIYFMRTDNLELNDNVGEAVYSHPIRRKSA